MAELLIAVAGLICTAAAYIAGRKDGADAYRAEFARAIEALGQPRRHYRDRGSVDLFDVFLAAACAACAAVAVFCAQQAGLL